MMRKCPVCKNLFSVPKGHVDYLHSCYDGSSVRASVKTEDRLQVQYDAANWNLLGGEANNPFFKRPSTDKKDGVYNASFRIKHLVELK